ncbi:hypothetical protein OIU74_028689 [Salix koriyanagi]|uniref:Uncharacterized protein n=1 Tax=Salix koriyanagi TaxID=2511006 RepID=A0A9Q0VEG6_9ROSI|nr:hypothetical protein OIU74_028689 [Salix koriyanagi]
MVKPKQRHVAAKPASKKNDSDGEDGWVIVKKQRVTILVPPLRSGRMLDPGPSKPEAAMPVKAVNNKSTVLIETSTNTMRMPLADEEENLAPLASNRGGDPTTATTPPPAHHFSALHSLRRLNVTMESRKPSQADTFRSIDAFRVSNISKTFKRPRLFLDSEMLLNQRLRASLLEKKLQKAGGLSRWLASIGLRQFVRMFSREEFQQVSAGESKHEEAEGYGCRCGGPSEEADPCY